MMTIMAATDRKAQSHTRILEVAGRAIRRAGYEGVGVADIMKEAGLTHGGFYAHFASRDAMLVEALQRAADNSLQQLAASVAERRAAGEEHFAALVNSYLHDSQLTATESGCVVAALASETPRQPGAVRDSARDCIQRLVHAVREALPAARADQAPAAAAAMVGGLQLARSMGGKAGAELLAGVRHALLQQYAAASN